MALSVKDMFQILQNIPFSTMFILLIATSISFLTSLANRLLSNPEKMKASKKEVDEWNKQIRKAQKSGDAKRVETLMKKQKYILQLQSKMTWQQTKVMLLFFVPLIIIWQVLGGFYTINGQPIPLAYFPGIGPEIRLPLLGVIPSLFWWYLLCSFFVGQIFTKLFGLTRIG